jgi:hypothetical protein
MLPIILYFPEIAYPEEAEEKQKQSKKRGVNYG